MQAHIAKLKGYRHYILSENRKQTTEDYKQMSEDHRQMSEDFEQNVVSSHACLHDTPSLSLIQYILWLSITTALLSPYPTAYRV